MSLVFWSTDELRGLVRLSDEVYERAKKLGEEAGRKFYDGLMTVMGFKGSTETAVKFVEIQFNAAMPIAILDERNLWNANHDFIGRIIRQIDPSSPIDKLLKTGKEDPSKFVGKNRLYLPGAWGEIASFYILNVPIPSVINIIYIIHLATYVTTFTTATIPEIYTGSEEFLKLVEGITTKKGAIEFLTRLLRRRYIPEDVYADALEAVQRRRELGFKSLRDVLEEHEAKSYTALMITRGIYGVITQLQDIVEKSREGYVDRRYISNIVGEIYSLIKSLEDTIKEYESVLDKLNKLLTSSGEKINIDKVRQLIEEISG